MIQQIWHKDGVIMENGLTPCGGEVYINGKLANTKGEYESLVIIPGASEIIETLADNRAWKYDEVLKYYEDSKKKMTDSFDRYETLTMWIMFVAGIALGLSLSLLI